jgi:hypothetical protein
MARIKDVLDDDGNVIAPPPPEHPVMAVIYLLEYGRKRGFKIGPTVQVGDTIVQVADLRQAARQAENAQNNRSDLDPDSDMAVLLGGG